MQIHLDLFSGYNLLGRPLSFLHEKDFTFWISSLAHPGSRVRLPLILGPPKGRGGKVLFLCLLFVSHSTQRP